MTEIAKLAGVSSATVSRVIHGSPLVNDETRIRVRKVLDQVAFIPDNNATALRKGNSGLFGMIVPDPSNPFFTDLLNCFETILSNEGQDLLFASTHFDPQRVEICIRRMLMRRVDGIVLAASELITSHESLKRYGVPVVTAERGETADRVSDVSVDFDDAMIDAVRYVRKLGHRRIAFIGGFPGPKVSLNRLQSFRRAIEHGGLHLDERLVQEGDYRPEGGAAAMSRLLQLRHRPTAVLTVNDLTALGALQLLQERGVRVPADVSLLGFDNIAMTELVSPKLTTLSISREDMASSLYKALNDLRENKSRKGQLYKIRASLLVRDSVADLSVAPAARAASRFV